MILHYSSGYYNLPIFTAGHSYQGSPRNNSRRSKHPKGLKRMMIFTYNITSTILAVEFLIAFLVAFAVYSILTIVASESLLICHRSLCGAIPRCGWRFVSCASVSVLALFAGGSELVCWFCFLVVICWRIFVHFLADHQILSNFSSVGVGRGFFILILSVAGELFFAAHRWLVIVICSCRSLTTCLFLVNGASTMLTIRSLLPLAISELSLVSDITAISSGMISCGYIRISEVSDISSIVCLVLFNACFTLSG